MKIKDLKKKIENLPDDMEVVRPGCDHSYVKIYQADAQMAEKNKRDYYEYWDDENMNKGSTKEEVLVIQ